MVHQTSIRWEGGKHSRTHIVSKFSLDFLFVVDVLTIWNAAIVNGNGASGLLGKKDMGNILFLFREPERRIYTYGWFTGGGICSGRGPTTYVIAGCVSISFFFVLRQPIFLFFLWAYRVSVKTQYEQKGGGGKHGRWGVELNSQLLYAAAGATPWDLVLVGGHEIENTSPAFFPPSLQLLLLLLPCQPSNPDMCGYF